MPIARILPATYKSNVRFDNVQFAYPSHPDVSILNEVSFTLSDGEMLAVVSASETLQR
jgi:ABC-type multidrug transport system fused ATPase/permease subunit